MSFPWRTALFVSLALNIAGISAVVGAFASGARVERVTAQPTALAAAQPLPPGAFMGALPPEARLELRDDMVRTFNTAGPQRQQAREARMAVVAAARANPFDPAAMRAALARMRAADAAVTGSYHEAVVLGFTRLTPQQRQRAVDALMRAPARRPGAAPMRPAGVAPLTPAERMERRQERREVIRERIQNGEPLPPRLRQRIQERRDGDGYRDAPPPRFRDGQRPLRPGPGPGPRPGPGAP